MTAKTGLFAVTAAAAIVTFAAGWAAGPLCGYMGCAVSGRAKDEA